MTVKALVAVRSGSQRVLNKNIKPFAGSTLLELKIRQLSRIKALDGITVNSDDDEMLKTAASMGCETVKRDERYASNSVSMSEVYKNMAENFTGDVIVYANVTNPLIRDETIETAVSRFIGFNGAYNSLNSGHLIKEFMFKENKPINYDLLRQPRSQDLPDIYALNFAVSVILRKDMIKFKNVVADKPFIYGINEIEGMDIDTPLDFEFAEFCYKKYEPL
jgi:CMP-N-acetylneuraminic acid synthetase